MDALIGVLPTLAPNIEPRVVLSTVSPEVLDYSDNDKVEDPPPKVDIPFGDTKV